MPAITRNLYKDGFFRTSKPKPKPQNGKKTKGYKIKIPFNTPQRGTGPCILLR